MFSLQAKLSLVIGGFVLIIQLLTASLSYTHAAHEIEEVYDAELSRVARLMMGLMGEEMDERLSQQIQEALNTFDSSLLPDKDLGILSVEEEGTPAGHVYEKLTLLSVWENNKLLFSTHPIAQIESPVAGYAWLEINQEPWRGFSIKEAKHNRIILVAQDGHIREEMVKEVALDPELFKLLFGVPLVVLIVWFGTGLGLRSLHKLSQQVSERNADNLIAVDLPGIPKELSTLVFTLNQFMEVLDKVFKRERRFTADAAHELKTPLAALRIHVENSLEAKTEQQRNKSLRSVLQGIDRMSRVVKQLLTLSRLEPKQFSQSKFKKISLNFCMEDILDEIKRSAEKKSIKLVVSGEAHIFGDRASLETMLRNLLDNAIQYTPENGIVSVQFLQESWTSRLIIEDSGPGIAETERAKVLQRFYRTPGSKGSGVGLGLSIIHRIVQLHQAELTLESSQLGGLKTEIKFSSSVKSE